VSLRLSPLATCGVQLWKCVRLRGTRKTTSTEADGRCRGDEMSVEVMCGNKPHNSSNDLLGGSSTISQINSVQVWRRGGVGSTSSHLSLYVMPAVLLCVSDCGAFI
jgi:hypothetical protein